MGRIVVLGSVNADLVVSVPRRPSAGETLMGGDVTVLPGGKGANQAAAAGWLGGEVWLAGCAGRDGFADVVMASLAQAGVNTSRVRRSDRPTGMAFITVARDGDNAIVVAPGANYAVTDADVDALGELLADADVLVLQLELPIPFVERAVALGAASGCAVVLNLAPAATVCASTLRNTQVLVVNETEARFLLGGGDDVERTTGQLLALGPRQVVVTLGAQGAVVNDAGVVSRIEAPAVQAVDTTGAGDAFVGALSVGLASGTPLAAAVQFAVTAASATVGTAGAQASHPVLASLIAD